MTIKKILTEPDPFLRQKSKVVEKVDDEIRRLMDDMLDTMYSAQGIGLAAIQIGIAKRIIVIDLLKEKEKKNPLYFVNPEIIWSSKEDATYEENCHRIIAYCQLAGLAHSQVMEELRAAAEQPPARTRKPRPRKTHTARNEAHV